MFTSLLGISLLPTTLALVQYAGVNIAGFEFGCSIEGTCTISSIVAPLTEQGGPDGTAQMNHFVKDDGMNIFRLPVSWQYLVNNQLGGTLDEANAANYDALVQACLGTGASCVIDIHNYARWNGQVIGQGGPTNEEFASLWSQLATKYANDRKVIFGIMNEPHDLSVSTWAGSVQAAVTAIRQAGAADNICLLPGSDFTSAANFISDGSADALSNVTNPGGGVDGLIFDVHKYLDSDNSGSHSNCVGDFVSSAFSPLADYLRSNGRQAMLSETGGGNDTSCVTAMCSTVKFLNDNSDVYVGYIGWAAGSFDTSYVLTLTPTGDEAGGFTDQPLLSQCFARRSNATSPVSASNSTAPCSLSHYTTSSSVSESPSPLSPSAPSTTSPLPDSRSSSTTSVATPPPTTRATSTSVSQTSVLTINV